MGALLTFQNYTEYHKIVYIIQMYMVATQWFATNVALFHTLYESSG